MFCHGSNDLISVINMLPSKASYLYRKKFRSMWTAFWHSGSIFQWYIPDVVDTVATECRLEKKHGLSAQTQIREWS